MLNYIVFDLETTGFSPTNNEIIEIGAWKVDNGVVVDKFEALVKPTTPIPTKITEITGITNEMVKDAEPIETVLVEFFDFCGGLPFLNHNSDFDYNFVTVIGKRLGLDFTLNNTRGIQCTLKLSRKYLPNISHKLCDVADYYKIKIDGVDGESFHRASYDAYVTKLIYDNLLTDFPTLEVTSPFIQKNEEYGEVKNNVTFSFK